MHLLLAAAVLGVSLVLPSDQVTR